MSNVRALPRGWAMARLDELFNSITDGDHQPPPQAADGVPFVVIGDIRRGAIDFSDVRYVPPSYYKSLPPAKKPQLGDLLYTVTGSFGIALLLQVDRPFCVQRHIAILKPDASTHTRYVTLALSTSAALHQAATVATGTAQKTVGLARLRAMTIPLAPTKEQQRIVDALESLLSRLDAAAAGLERARARLKAYRASVLKAAVEGRLVPTEAELARNEGRSYEPADVLLGRILKERRRRWEEAELAKMKARTPKDDGWKAKYEEPTAPKTGELPDLPEGWCWATTDQLFWFVTSGSRGWARYYSESGAAFIRIGNLDHDSITLDFSKIQHVCPPLGSEGTRTRLAPGDLLISITADVGMIGLAPDQIPEAYINQHVSLARPVRSLCASYLAWFLAARDGGQRQFLALQRGATKVGLGLDDIRSVSVPIPPLKEQYRIVDEIERCVSVAASCQTAISTSYCRVRRLRQAILKWAFEGKLVDQNPAEEPAAALLARIRAERASAAPARPKRRRMRMLEAAS